MRCLFLEGGGTFFFQLLTGCTSTMTSNTENAGAPKAGGTRPDSLAMFLMRVSKPLNAIGEWLGRISSWLVMAVMLVVLTAVIMNAAGLNQLMEWDSEMLLFGHAITINSIIELQWHLFGLLTLIGGSYALHSNTHVRVDMFYARFSQTGKYWVDILGHAFLLIPFCLLVAWYSRHFVEMSFISGERSNYGGMTDRYLIKGALPAGLVLLALSALGQIFDRLARLLDPQLDLAEQGE